MEDFTVVAVDAMGGDNAPGEIVRGSLEALKANEKIKVILVGEEEAIRRELSSAAYDEARLTVAPASEVITTNEAPEAAIRHKKDSSICVGEKLVKDGKADAFVSAGSTGAVLVGGQLIVGRIRGIERTPIATVIPTRKGISLLVDSGANVDSRSSHLVQYARMGSLYMEHIMHVNKPTVGIVNVGVEEEKGNALVKETYPLLKECADINFTGSVEARDIPFGAADVIVCDAFVGNVILKMYEGVAGALIGMIKETLVSSFRTKLGALLIMPALKSTLKVVDASEYGAAPLLGLKGLVIKAHGSSKAKEIRNSILQCITFREQHITEIISDSLGSQQTADLKGEET